MNNELKRAGAALASNAYILGQPAGPELNPEIRAALATACRAWDEAVRATPAAASAGAAGTIDTPEFRLRLSIAGYDIVNPAPTAALIAHIDQHTAAADLKARNDVARALGLGTDGIYSFAWSYLLSSIEACAKGVEEQGEEIERLRAATAPVSAAPTAGDDAKRFDAAIASGALKWDHKAGARAIAYEGFKAACPALPQSAGAPVSAAEPDQDLMKLATDALAASDARKGDPEAAQRAAEAFFADGQELPALPSTPEEIIAFIGGHYDSMEEAENPENVRFQLSVHDLQSAFVWWRMGFAEVAAKQAGKE
jgi:hypothetical protein